MEAHSEYQLTCTCGDALVSHHPVCACRSCGRTAVIEWRICPCGQAATELSLYCRRCQWTRKQERIHLVKRAVGA